MKTFFCSFLLIIFCTIASSAAPDSLLTELGKTISEAHNYDSNKTTAISQLKKMLLKESPTDLQQTFIINQALYQEYKLFNYDSAFLYASKLLTMAHHMQDKDLITDAKLKLSFIMLSSGLFTETYDSLATINIQNSPDTLKADYFTQFGRYYYDIAAYDSDPHYSVKYDIIGSAYMDSALRYYDAGSFQYRYYKGLKLYKQSYTDSAFVYFDQLMNTDDLAYHQLALTASTLSSIYLQKNETDKGIELLAQAAIADIKGSVKETFAIFTLAELLFKKGDVKYTSLFIENAIANANAYGARQRKAQVSSILPLIERERINAVEARNRQLVLYGTATTLLLVTLAVLIIIIRRQVQKVQAAKLIITEAHSQQQHINKILDDTVKKLEDSHSKLEQANTQLEQTNMWLADANAKLVEANKIKEECVSYFFNLDSEFNSKLERLKTLLEKKVAEKKLEEIKFIINNINIKEEKESLLQSFDKVFLRIYPNFISAFNTFFLPHDKVTLHGNELLNSDLRIFALIRMGITDNDKIARILGYSVNTIYTYKTKIKNKSIVPKDEFEQRLMDIKSA